MLGVTSSIDPKLIKKDYGGKKIKIKAMAMTEKMTGEKYKSKSAYKKHEKSESKSDKASEKKKNLFSKSNKLPFMVKIKMAAAMNKKSKKC
jgi:hypothetical protein